MHRADKARVAVGLDGRRGDLTHPAAAGVLRRRLPAHGARSFDGLAEVVARAAARRFGHDLLEVPPDHLFLCQPRGLEEPRVHRLVAEAAVLRLLHREDDVGDVVVDEREALLPLAQRRLQGLARRDVAEDVDGADDLTAAGGERVGAHLVPAVAEGDVQRLPPAGLEHPHVGAAVEEAGGAVHELVAGAAAEVVRLHAEEPAHAAVAADDHAVAIEEADQVGEGVERPAPVAGRALRCLGGALRLDEGVEEPVHLPLRDVGLKIRVGVHAVAVAADGVAGDHERVGADHVEQDLRREALAVVLADRPGFVPGEEAVQLGLVLDQAVAAGGAREDPRHLPGDAQRSEPVGQRPLGLGGEERDHGVGVEGAVAEVGLARGEERERAAAGLGLGVDARGVKGGAELRDGVRAGDADAAFAGGQPQPHVGHHGRELLFARAVDEAHVVVRGECLDRREQAVACGVGAHASVPPSVRDTAS